MINLLIFLINCINLVMQSKLDIFIIILFVITVSIIIGLSVVNMIDKKISNISVNIPPLKVPKQTVVVKFGENHIQCDAKERVQIPEYQQVKDTILKDKKEGFEEVKPDDIVEYDNEPKHEPVQVKGIVGSKEPPKKYEKCGTKRQPTKNYPRLKIGPYKLKAANYDKYEVYSSPYKLNRAVMPPKDIVLKPTLPKPFNSIN